MYYEAKYLLYFDGLRMILMMNCFEFLIGSTAILDGRESNFRQDFSYIIDKHGYV